jgi:membrane protein DedA with SNARE-associated domain
MMLTHELLARHSAWIVFFNVLASSLGLPVPSTTVLMTIAASVVLVHHDPANAFAHFSVLLGAAVAGGAIGDLLWFFAGKRYGKRVQTFVLQLTVPKRSSMTRFEQCLVRCGARMLVVARFVPGLSLVAVPLCGSMAIGTRSFVVHDCISIALWACAAFVAGALLAAHIDALLSHACHSGWQMAIPGCAPILLIAVRCVMRRLRKRTANRALT